MSQKQIIKALLVLGAAIVGCAILIAIVLIYKRLCKCNSLSKLCQKVQNALMFNSILRYIMMTFLTTMVGCSRQVRRAVDHVADVGSYQSILTLLVLLAYLILTILLTRIVLRNKHKLQDSAFKSKFGTLYTPCEIERGSGPLYFILIFCLRRWIIAISIGLYMDNAHLQLTLCQLLCTVVVAWHLQIWPMENNKQNMLYVLNEYMYLTCAFFMLGFTNYSYEPESRFQIGWFYLFCLGIILAFNIVVMFSDIVQGIRMSILRRRHHKKVKQAMMLRAHRKLHAEIREKELEAACMRELSRRPKITIKEDEEGDLSIVSENSIQRMYEEFKV